jgi:hypothetical protein
LEAKYRITRSVGAQAPALDFFRVLQFVLLRPEISGNEV